MTDSPSLPPPSAEWASLTHRFTVAGHKGYLTVACDPGGRPFLLEIRMAKAGGVLRGLLDSLAISVSLGLQRGIPLDAYVDALALARFEPAGWSAHSDIGYAHSVVDYVFRWLALRFPAPGSSTLPPPATDGTTCSACRRPLTWEPGAPCPECGHIDLSAA